MAIVGKKITNIAQKWSKRVQSKIIVAQKTPVCDSKIHVCDQQGPFLAQNQ